MADQEAVSRGKPMSVGSVSLYQQDQNYWNQAQAQSQASSAQNSLINVIGAAMTDLSKGEASIANGIALKRVNSQLSAAVQAALGGSTSSATSSTATSSSASSSSAASKGAPATGVGTVPLSTGTSLATLGILPGGKISVTTGLTTTTYVSTGSDTVGDLINALNVNLSTNAQVTASLNGHGQLVITGRNDTAYVTVSGTGTDAAAIGFGVGHTTFKPTAPTPAASAPATSSASTSASAGSSTGKSSKSSKTSSTSASVATTSLSTAAGILSADGVSGSLVDMLA
jgi:hypothetical protein